VEKTRLFNTTLSIEQQVGKAKAKAAALRRSRANNAAAPRADAGSSGAQAPHVWEGIGILADIAGAAAAFADYLQKQDRRLSAPRSDAGTEEDDELRLTEIVLEDFYDIASWDTTSAFKLDDSRPA
jgi:hypothetical protein